MIRTFIAAALVFCFIQCGGKKEAATTEEQAAASESGETTGPQFIVDHTFQEQLAHLFSAYLKVKDAFVATDPAKVKEEALHIRDILHSVETKMLSGAALNDWASYSSSIEISVSEITGSTDIEVQRTAFSALSDVFYKSIKAFGLGSTTAYYDFCPMAFNDQGAYWLSDVKEIRNPYFGDKMLTCGRVTEELH
jgi:Cu(I)/Ag(I) efflux system membrane fusion protein